MAPVIAHPFVSAIADDPAAVLAGKVVPSNWNANHAIQYTYAAFSGTANTAGNEDIVECTSGTFTLTLTNPSAAWQTKFKNSGAGVVTLSGTIDGAGSFILAAGASVTLAFNATNWLVF